MPFGRPLLATAQQLKIGVAINVCATAIGFAVVARYNHVRRKPSETTCKQRDEMLEAVRDLQSEVREFKAAVDEFRSELSDKK